MCFLKSCTMPAPDVLVCEMRWVLREKVNEPSQQPVPPPEIAGRYQLPPKFFQCPVRLCAVAEHGRCNPVCLVVCAAASNWDHVIYSREQLPIDHVRFGHLPIRMEREIRWQYTRKQAKRTRENKLSARVPINEPIPDEDCGAFGLRVSATRGLGRGKRIVPAGYGSCCLNVTGQQAIADCLTSTLSLRRWV